MEKSGDAAEEQELSDPILEESIPEGLISEESIAQVPLIDFVIEFRGKTSRFRYDGEPLPDIKSIKKFIRGKLSLKQNHDVLIKRYNGIGGEGGDEGLAADWLVVGDDEIFDEQKDQITVVPAGKYYWPQWASWMTRKDEMPQWLKDEWDKGHDRESGRISKAITPHQEMWYKRDSLAHTSEYRYDPLGEFGVQITDDGFMGEKFKERPTEEMAKVLGYTENATYRPKFRDDERYMKCEICNPLVISSLRKRLFGLSEDKPADKDFINHIWENSQTVEYNHCSYFAVPDSEYIISCRKNETTARGYLFTGTHKYHDPRLRLFPEWIKVGRWITTEMPEGLYERTSIIRGEINSKTETELRRIMEDMRIIEDIGRSVLKIPKRDMVELIIREYENQENKLDTSLWDDTYRKWLKLSDDDREDLLNPSFWSKMRKSRIGFWLEDDEENIEKINSINVEDDEAVDEAVDEEATPFDTMMEVVLNMSELVQTKPGNASLRRSGGD